MNLFTLTSMLVVAAVLLLIGLLWFLLREINRSALLFEDLAVRFGGHTTRVPFGLVYHLEGHKVRIYALQGSVQYRVRIRLSRNPGIHITRTFENFRWLDVLQYSPGRRKHLFQHDIDQSYSFRTRDTGVMRELFPRSWLARLATTGRIAGIRIRGSSLTGALMILNHSPEENTRVVESLELLNDLARHLVNTSLAK